MTAGDLLKGTSPIPEMGSGDDVGDDEGADDDDGCDDTPERTGRGKAGKGAGSKAVPEPLEPREIVIAKAIIDAALALYDCSNEAPKLNVGGAVDNAIEVELRKAAGLRGAVLSGFRYAVELLDVFDVEDAEKSPSFSELHTQ